MIGSKRNQKLVAGGKRFGIKAWADYFHYGDEEECPFLIYIGGAISPKDYRRRRDTLPEPITREFEKAFTSDKSLDLLIIPNPLFDDSLLSWSRGEFLQFLVFDLLPQTTNPRPPALGVVGYSRGAFLAACLAFDLPRVVAAALIGGSDTTDAVKDGVSKDKKFMLYSNADDPLVMENYVFMKMLVDRGMNCDADLREGGHEFDDYAGNGSVADAFRYVISNLGY